MHLGGEMNQVLSGNTATTVFAAQSSTYNVTGTSLTEDTFENSDRKDRVALGSDIPSIIFNITARDSSTPTALEYAIFKIERAHEVPLNDNTLLPDTVTCQTLGLQAAIRQYQPGRVLKFGIVAIATEQPRTFSVKGNYGKFKMAKMRTGDWYGIMFFNRGLGDITLDVHTRFLAKI